MNNISFMLTVDQIKARTKKVTRRMGWKNLKPGTLLQGVVKGQGLKKGEKIQKLAVIRVVSVRREPLRMMIDKMFYGLEEIKKEGFENQHRSAVSFVRFFCRSHKGCTPESEVTRIEFEYVD